MHRYSILGRFADPSYLRIYGAGVLVTIAGTTASAQQISGEAVTLDAIVTTASNREQPIRDVQASVQLIDEEDLDAYAGTSVTEALKMAVGVDARALGSNSNVIIRGFELRPGAMLVDGLRRPSKYGSVNPSLLSLQDVSSIEVVRGPMSALYGADANGGAINVKTRSPLLDEGVGGNVRAMYGATTDRNQRRTGVVGASVHFGTENLRQRVHIEHRHRNPYRFDTSEDIPDLNRNKHTFVAHDAALRVSGDHQLRWQGEYVKQDDTGPGVNAGNSYTAYEKEERWFGALRYSGSVGPGELSADVAYGYADGATTRSYPIIETTRYHQFQSQMRYALDLENHSLLLGAGFISDRINVNVNSNEGRRDNTHFLIQDEWRLPADWTLLAGVRHDNYSDFGSVTTPRISLQKRIGTRGAVLGGVTAVFDMPNTNPLTLTAADLQAKLDLADGRAWCDYAFYMGGSAVNAEQLDALERLPGCAGVKIFMGSSFGDLLTDDDTVLRRIMSHGHRRIAIHAEDEARLNERRALAQASGNVCDHPLWRDVDSALIATQRIVSLATETGRRLHLLHVSSAEEIAFLARHKRRVSVEVTPHHLTLVAPQCYERLGSLAQMNPPVRGARHRDALWRAINDGVVDVLGSDHAPHTLQEKAQPYPQSPSGITGVQTLLPVMLDHVQTGQVSLERLVDLTSAGPARVFGLAGKGRISVGCDADLTLVDLHARREITNRWIASVSGWTPYDGLLVTGWPTVTVVGGRLVVRDGELVGQPTGRPVDFLEVRPPFITSGGRND